MSGNGDVDGDVSGEEAAWRDLVARFDLPVDTSAANPPWPAREDLTEPARDPPLPERDSAPGWDQTGLAGQPGSGTGSPGTTRRGPASPGTASPGAASPGAGSPGVGSPGPGGTGPGLAGTGGAGSNGVGTSGTGPTRAGRGGHAPGGAHRGGTSTDETSTSGPGTGSRTGGPQPGGAKTGGSGMAGADDAGPKAPGTAGWPNDSAGSSGGRHAAVNGLPRDRARIIRAAGSVPRPAPPRDDEEDDGSYVPPPPEPLPRLDPIAKGAWAGLLGGPGYLLVATLLGWQVSDWAALIAIVAFVAGFATLVLRMGDRPRGDDDDGAVV